METKNIYEEITFSLNKHFKKNRKLTEDAVDQLSDKEVHFKPDEESNSVAILLQHLSNNMVSRFTDFLTSDGEKPNRNRDAEFIEQNLSKEILWENWKKSWQIFDDAFNKLSSEHLTKKILIRNEPQSVIDALHRHLAHLSYHVGQIISLAKWIKKDQWRTLSVPKGKSEEFNSRTQWK